MVGSSGLEEVNEALEEAVSSDIIDQVEEEESYIEKLGLRCMLKPSRTTVAALQSNPVNLGPHKKPKKKKKGVVAKLN